MEGLEPDLYVSKSSLESWFRCPALWHGKYPLGVREVKGSLLPARGNVLHSGILGGILAGSGEYGDVVQAAWSDEDAGVVQAAGDDEIALVEAVLMAACKVFKPLRLTDRVILHEKKLTRDQHVSIPGEDPAKLSPLVRYTIKCDGVMQGGLNPSPYVFELKTTKSYINDQYWEKSLIDRQTWFYMNELREHHMHDVQSLCWQVVKLPTQKKYRYSEMGLSWGEYVERISDMMSSKTETWFPYTEHYWDDSVAAKFKLDLARTVKLQLLALEHRLFPRNTGACFDFARRCEFWPVCHEGDTFENKQLYQLRRDR